MVCGGYAEHHLYDCLCMWNPLTKKVTETRYVIWLHRMYYQDAVHADVAMLLEVCMAVHEISKDTIAMMMQGVTNTRESCRVDPVHDIDEVEVASKLESKAREGEVDDEVTEASNSKEDEKPACTRSEKVLQIPKKYDDFKMTAAEICLLQAETSLDMSHEVVLVGAAGMGFTSTADLHIMTYNEAMKLSKADAWQKEVDKEHD